MPLLKIIITTVLLLSLLGNTSTPGQEIKPSREWLVGGDISALTLIEKHGGVFRDNGKDDDFFAICGRRGWNCYRLRIFVNPTGRGAVVQDLPYTIALAKRIKAAGAALLLNFHYSDTWADPGHQNKPAAWQDLDADNLEKKVIEYTASVISAFKKEGVLPEIVQVGNEITPGMLWPEGKIRPKDKPGDQWDNFVRFLKAGIKGVNQPLDKNDKVRIMIHIDKGGNWETTRWFFDNIIQRGAEFDIIGQSFYPWWHGSMDDLRQNLKKTALTYDKDIMVVETAYPYSAARWWSGKKNMAWPVTPAGQQAFLQELARTVRQTPNHRGIGINYWYPESIPVQDFRVWNGGATALFDNQGNALPALGAFTPPGKDRQPTISPKPN